MASPKCINCQNIENSIDLIIIRAIHKGTLTKCITRHSKYHITDHKMWCVIFIGYTVMVTASWHHKCTAAQIQPTFYLRFSLFVCRKTMKDGNMSRVHSCREKLQETTSEVCVCVGMLVSCYSIFHLVGRKRSAYIYWKIPHPQNISISKGTRRGTDGAAQYTEHSVSMQLFFLKKSQ